MDELNEALKALEARAGRRAAKVNAERVAARVVERLRTEPAVERPTWGGGRMLRVAAMAAVVITGGALATTLLRGPEPAASLGACALPVCPTELTAAQSDSLLRSLDEVRALNGAARSSSPSVEELNEDQLRALLQAMQSSEEASL